MKLLTAVVFTFLSVSAYADSLHIMLTNDDGIDAPGLRAVYKALVAAGHRVSVVAPSSEQSSTGTSFNPRETSFTKRTDSEWAVDSTPATAVIVGLQYFLEDDRPDLVVSGANMGQNAGVNVNYSGTVSAALTAFTAGVPAIAISVARLSDEFQTQPRFSSTVAAFPDAAAYLVSLIEGMNGVFDSEAIININYPAVSSNQVKGIRFTELSSIGAVQGYELVSPGVVKPILNFEVDSDERTDAGAVSAGYISISFLNTSLAADKIAIERLTRRLSDVVED
jgi:5'/3'-nucleotidase SurE